MKKKVFVAVLLALFGAAHANEKPSEEVELYIGMVSEICHETKINKVKVSGRAEIDLRGFCLDVYFDQTTPFNIKINNEKTVYVKPISYAFSKTVNRLEPKAINIELLKSSCEITSSFTEDDFYRLFRSGKKVSASPSNLGLI